MAKIKESINIINYWEIGSCRMINQMRYNYEEFIKLFGINNWTAKHIFMIIRRSNQFKLILLKNRRKIDFDKEYLMIFYLYIFHESKQQ